MSKAYAKGTPEREAYKKDRAARRAAKTYKKAYTPAYKDKAPGMLSTGGAAAGGALGTALGGPAGTAIGTFLGGKLGHLIEQITGFGDYNIEQNSIMKGGMTVPQVVNSTDKGGVIIRHREYIRDIPASTAFNALKFPLNPGSSTTFPWLSQAAGLFEQYRFRGVLFEFVSLSSDAVLSGSTSSALGSVCLATDYDAMDAPFGSKREMLNSMFASSSKPSCTFIHPIECKTSLSPMRLQYVRTTQGFPPNGDPRMYDLGSTYIATEGMQAANGVAGELWVTYEVELYKQQLAVDDGITDHWKIASPTSAALLGINAASRKADPENSIGGSINSAGTIYSFPNYVSEGLFLFQYSVFGTAATLGNFLPTVSGGALYDIWNHTSMILQSPAATALSAECMVSFVVKVTAVNCAVTFPNIGIPTAGRSDFIVTSIPPSFTDFPFP